MERLCMVGLLLLGAIAACSAGTQCRDESGAPVDWYVLYKLPTLSGSKDYLSRHGLAYLYVTSKAPDADWKLSALSVNDSRSMPGQTLAPLYGPKNADLLQILYNDDPPSITASTAYGHTKGVVLTEKSGGFWLIHSVPNFPVEPITPKTNQTNKYFYPNNAVRYGQSFLCISLSADQMNNVGTQLMFNKPRIYVGNVPEPLSNTFGNLTAAARKSYVKKAPWTSKIVLKSLAGVEFTSYAKAGSFGQDLYSGLVAPDIGGDLQVETWSNGPGELPSDCHGKYHVMDVKEITTKPNNTEGIRFKNSQDHSKWAVTVSSDLSRVCIGDINRMTSQFKRGGGTVCIQNSSLWKRYSKAVSDVQPCPAGRSANSIH